MHFVCSTFGSSGDVFPVLGLALELRGRGHQVTFATNEHFAATVAEYGLPFEPLGSKEQFMAAINDPDLWHPRRAFRQVLHYLQPVLRQQYELHARLAGSGNVVGITNSLGFGALMAQDRLRLPVVTVHCQPAVLWSDRQPPALPGLFGPRWLKGLLYRVGERLVLDPVVCPFLNAWRQELGLPPVRRITRWWNSRFGILCLFPDWFAPPKEDWPEGIMQTDFPLWNHQSDQGLAPAVEEFLARGAPPLVFTPGSANLYGQRFFQAAVEACQALQRPGILLTPYPDQLPRSLPASVAHFGYVPLDLLLPRSAAFVHHGGIGSTSQAMLAGIPQVLMPLAHDQFDNASRVQRLGLGDWIPARRFSGPRLTAKLRRLLALPTVLAACRAAAQRLAARDGLRRSAAAIEERLAKAVGSSSTS